MQEKHEEVSEKELNVFVQGLLKQMQESFEQMSESIITKIDDMGRCLS
jgi:hypothetical protein